MTTRTVKLVGPDRVVLATAQVTGDGQHYAGTVDLRATPAQFCALFEELEEIVNGQMFSFLDDIQDRLAAQPVLATFDDGRELRVSDLQIFPSTGDISFRVAGAPVDDARVGSIPVTHFPAESPATAQPGR